MTKVEIIAQEIKNELSKPEVVRAIMATTFKGLEETKARQALMEGMIRGFTFQDFLEKKVYAIPYAQGYSLVTSIDYARSIGQKSGVVGKSAPVFEMENGKPVSCSVTIKKKVLDEIGEFTATVYFDEYSTGKNLWVTKPRTMLAKVAEMHALRMACPEELDKAYTEEEMNGGASTIELLDENTKAEIDSIETVEALNEYYKANKGRGKAFDKYVIERKRELEAKDIRSEGTEPK